MTEPAQTAATAEAAPRSGSRPGPVLLPVATPARTRAAVAELLRPHRRLALTGFTVMVASTAVGLLVQPLLGRIVDLAADRGSVDAITATAALLVAVAVAQGVTAGFGLSLIARLGRRPWPGCANASSNGRWRCRWTGSRRPAPVT